MNLGPAGDKVALFANIRRLQVVVRLASRGFAVMAVETAANNRPVIKANQGPEGRNVAVRTSF